MANGRADILASTLSELLDDRDTDPVSYRFGSSSTVFGLLNFTTGNDEAVVNANYHLVLRASA